jgi:hypothetical protein
MKFANHKAAYLLLSGFALECVLRCMPVDSGRLAWFRLFSYLTCALAVMAKHQKIWRFSEEELSDHLHVITYAGSFFAALPMWWRTMFSAPPCAQHTESDLALSYALCGVVVGFYVYELTFTKPSRPLIFHHAFTLVTLLMYLWTPLPLYFMFAQHTGSHFLLWLSRRIRAQQPAAVDKALVYALYLPFMVITDVGHAGLLMWYTARDTCHFWMNIPTLIVLHAGVAFDHIRAYKYLYRNSLLARHLVVLPSPAQNA